MPRSRPTSNPVSYRTHITNAKSAKVHCGTIAGYYDKDLEAYIFAKSISPVRHHGLSRRF